MESSCGHTQEDPCQNEPPLLLICQTLKDGRLEVMTMPAKGPGRKITLDVNAHAQLRHLLFLDRPQLICHAGGRS